MTDKNIFAFGDCAACPIKPGAEELVPPRAQAAHQQASLLYKTLKNRVTKPNKNPLDYVYKDYGSLVNLGPIFYRREPHGIVARWKYVC